MNAYDITDKIGPIYSYPGDPEWPMYSFNAPAYTVWNAIAARLNERGWSEAQIKTWLQSKDARWAMDGVLDDLLSQAADKFAQTIKL